MLPSQIVGDKLSSTCSVPPVQSGKLLLGGAAFGNCAFDALGDLILFPSHGSSDMMPSHGTLDVRVVEGEFFQLTRPNETVRRTTHNCNHKRRIVALLLCFARNNTCATGLNRGHFERAGLVFCGMLKRLSIAHKMGAANDRSALVRLRGGIDIARIHVSMGGCIHA